MWLIEKKIRKKQDKKSTLLGIRTHDPSLAPVSTLATSRFNFPLIITQPTLMHGSYYNVILFSPFNSELVANKGAFADFLLEYMAEDPAAADDEEIADIKHKLEETMGEENFRKEFMRQVREKPFKLCRQ